VGRLFWKFFLFIWLGQMAAVVGTSMLFWAERKNFEVRLNAEDGPPPPPGFPEHQYRPPPPGGVPPGAPPGGFEAPPPPPGMRLPIFPLLAGLLASVLCAAGLAWYFSRPIRQLRRGFDAVADGDLDARVAPGMQGRRDELADLGRDFDRMTERLQTLLDGQKRLLHDVSHEMRSPLARLQAAVGLARQQPGRIDDSLGRVERESERMNQLVGELLTLSRLEAGVIGEMESVDMAELLGQIVEDARFEAGARQIVVDYCPGEMADVVANSELLHRAVENVVRNALRFSPTGGVVRIEAGLGRKGYFYLAVADQGPGVGGEELDAIFTPFFRGSTPKSAEGYGLGLAIARRVLQGMKGSIKAGNGKAGGLVVEMEMPI
jgi:two-component system OmpR family sensor kinase